MATAASLIAGPSVPPEATPIKQGLQWLDWVIIVAYLGGVIALGGFFAKRQSSVGEYFIASRKHIHPVLVGISIYAALLSTISYLGKPGEVIGKGPVILIGQFLSIPLVYLAVAYWLIPKLMEQRVTSAYELLESRLGLTGRLLGAVLFIKLRVVWMGMLLYLASVAMVVFIGVDLKWAPFVSIGLGVVPLIYTSIGGLNAVVVANVVQFFLMLFGVFVSIALITIRCGGFSWWPTEWSPNWDVQPVFSFDPYIRATVTGALIQTLVWRICTAGGDQMVIQHYMATKDIAAARRSYLITSCATAVVTAILAILGLALLGFFTKFPELLGPGMTIQKNADQLFPYFITNLLPVGISGLVVAAVIAAASGIDTGVNAVTAVVMRDFLHRFGWRAGSEAQNMRVTKCMSFGIGFAVVGASLLVQKVPGNFLEMSGKLGALEATVIFGLFYLALFVRCATPLGAVLGVIAGLSSTVLVAFWDVLTGRPAISFLYIGVIGITCSLGVGYLTSRFGPPRDRAKRSLAFGVIFVALLAILIALLLTR